MPSVFSATPFIFTPSSEEIAEGRACAGVPYRSATSFASAPWLFPDSSLMELVAMPARPQDVRGWGARGLLVFHRAKITRNTKSWDSRFQSESSFPELFRI